MFCGCLFCLTEPPVLEMALLLLSVGTSAFQPPPPAVEARVQGLLKAMSNAEKARQLDMYSGRDFLSNGRFNATKASAVLGGGLGVGRIHDLYAQDPAVANEIQRAVVASSRHGIPALVGEEGVHGYQNDGHTIFPSPIATAASFNGTLAFLIGRVIGTEARVTGTHEVWSPVCGLAREPRWGRSNEPYPYP